MAACNKECFASECICAGCRKPCNSALCNKTTKDSCEIMKKKGTCIHRDPMSKSEVKYFVNKFYGVNQ